jgi:peptidyl-prolyl cis-trans isomerase D
MADSILKMIKSGQRFDSLAKKYGTDATKDKGGDLGTFGYGAMVPEFNSFCFTKPVGTLDVIQTQFGYHVVEITGQKNMSTAYKVAIMSKEIVASEATVAKANQEALKLSAFKSIKELDEYIAKSGLSKVTLPTLIKETDNQVGMLQDARQLVRWLYENREGAISEPFSIGDQYVVATVDKIYKEGTQDAKTARPMAERAIRNKKIAEMIIKKVGSNATLESAAAAYNLQVMTAGADSTLTFSSSMVNGLGVEPRVVGASFNKENQTKVSAPIYGGTGVYYIKVNSIGSKPADTPAQKELAIKGALSGMRSQVTANWYEGLKSQATIKDKRAELGY